ncbi:hypothetical protein ASE14_01900 [Agromyces sp. Root81]|uniref:serine/threonine-protein kinase n=1 Tax=Agromyces sp. Root81 TaxID=1736601 RepID=UPI0006FE846C|nr:serine/threonine-protein kinase [Agromyces sp. Root81]KRC62606.1 hypothetical protein ASE14_01900 [Agromyces sp. Root81]
MEATLAGYRLLRRIASGERADVFLATVDAPAESAPDEASPLVVVRVYDGSAAGEAIAVEVEAMSTDASGSLPELFDVATLDDGRCALAVERLAGPSLARLIAERRLAPGEAVTILAPIVVALGELARLGFVHTRLTAGDVLLDGRGRPRLIGLGGLARLSTSAHERTPLLRDGHAALADLIDVVVAATERPVQFAPVAELLHDRLSARPFTPCEAELERALFAAADPTPVTGVAAAVRRTSLPARMTAPLDPASSEPPTRATSSDASGPSGAAARNSRRTLLELAQWPSFLAGRIRDGGDPTASGREAERAGAGSRLRAAVRLRRPALLVAGLVGGGALALLLTLVPPATAGDDRAAGGEHVGGTDGVPVPPPESEAIDADEASDVGPTAGPEDDVVAAAQQLLTRREACFDALDLACLADVLQPGSALETADASAMTVARDGGDVPAELDSTRVDIVTDMGSAVLLTVPYATAEREPASLLVMRSEAGWRLREIFD